MPISEPTTNDYTKILDYLDSLDTATTKKKEEVKQPLPEKHKSSSALVLEEEAEVRKSTREIIKKSKTKEGKELPKKSSGFDVKKFESLLRTKLIDEYKKLGKEKSTIAVFFSDLYDRIVKFATSVREALFGKDGLIIENGFCKGLLLPQVPVEWKWDEETFLCQCCLKAGLPPDSWLVKGTRVYTFSSVIAEELAPKGDVTILDMRKRKPRTEK
jgi:hypothetical protein